MCGNNTGRRTRAGLLLAFALIGCASELEEPSLHGESTADAALEIKGGYPDDGDRAVTGVIVTDRRGKASRTCSSTLIAPNLVLTAQHCIAETPRRIACRTATFGEPVNPAQVFVTVGDALWTAGAPWIAARAVVSPPDGNAVCGRDIALIVLSSPIPGTEVTPLAPRLDRPPEVDEVYSAVGFGDTEGGVRDGGVRRRRDGLRVECVGYGCGTQERVAGSEWRGETGICSGDSGGPALDATGRIIGVTSRGPAGCTDPIYGGLIAHRDWLTRAARRAADESGDAAPWWATEAGGSGSLPSRPPLDERWLSCAHRPAAGGARGATTLALLALLALRRPRRAAPRARASTARESTIPA